ncbi:MAG: FecR family protein [Bacteroidota bacterium]
MSTYENDDTFLGRWLNGELTEAERMAFEQTAEFEEFKTIADEAKELTVKPYDKGMGWSELSDKTGGKVKRMMPWRVIAATLLLLISATFVWYITGRQTVETLAGQKQLVSLPDGSTALLNGQSELSYNSRFWSSGRSLQLSGEAFFEVNEGSEFKVNTEIGAVEVLGTSFNVYSRKTSFEVYCQTGRVVVSVDNERVEAILSAEEATRYNSDTDKLEDLNEASGPAWQIGENRYKSQPIGRVIQDLSAQFGFVFDVDFIDRDRPYTGLFLHADPDQALEMVFEPMGIAYVRNGNAVRLFVEE